MIWDIAIIATCAFVILRKTGNLWLTAGAFLAPYVVFKLLGDNAWGALLVYSVFLYMYGAGYFALLRKFYEDDNDLAFILTFCLGTVLKGVLFGWG